MILMLLIDDDDHHLNVYITVCNSPVRLREHLGNKSSTGGSAHGQTQGDQHPDDQVGDGGGDEEENQT